MAYFSYRQYYPSLASEMSHLPYSPRIKRDNEDVLPLHNAPSSSDDSHGVANGSSPFGQRPGAVRRFTDEERASEQYELDGTVQRPDPGPLEETWNQRTASHETMPREVPTAHHHYSPEPVR